MKKVSLEMALRSPMVLVIPTTFKGKQPLWIKFLVSMAGDLWDSAINQGSPESSYTMRSGWNCDFYFGHGHDLIEENALNEKSCSEVLRILITKADTEIGELEKDLKCLQVQLAAENEEVYELCCNLLKTRIKCFNMASRSLKINGSIIGAELSMPGRPARKAHEIVKNLLRSNIDKKDQENALSEESFLQVLKILITKANTEIHELEKDLEFLQTELAWAEHEEFSEICCDVLREKIDFLDKSLRSFSSNDDNDIGLQLPMRRKPADNIHEIVEALLQKYLQEREQQPSAVAILDSRSDASAHAIKLLTENREKRKLDSNIIEMEEIKEIEASTESSTSVSSLEIQEKKANNSKTIKLVVVYDWQGAAPEAGKGGVLWVWQGGPLRPVRCGVRAKPADAIVKVSSSNSLSFASGFFNDMKNSGNFDLKANGDMVIGEQHITPTEENKIGNSSLAHGEKGMLQKANQLSNAVVKHTYRDALKQPAFIYGRNKSSESQLSASRLAKKENCGVKRKLIGFVPQTSQQEGISDSKVPMMNKIDSSNSQSKTEVDVRNLVQIVTKSQHLALTLEDQIGKSTTETEPEEVREPHLGSHKAIVVYDKKSHLNVDVKPKTAMGKKKFQTYTKSVQGRTLSAAEIELQTPISKAKRQPKSDIHDDSAPLSQLIVWKPLKKSVQPDHCTKEHGKMVKKEKEQWHNCEIEFKDPILESKRKRKHASSLPFSAGSNVHASSLPFSAGSNVLAANMDDSVSPSNGTVSGCKALQMVKSSPLAVDSSGWAIVPVPSATFNFADLKVPELKAIAKKRKLKKFHKLKKKDLIELLEHPSCQ
ncbi:hypothetical protein FEM48_Zijuj12G0023200 [Ziziphus jujuba var. spinosa]|uniref:Rho termination factor N-terminal domain-containing protein n=1 Tax=Ziziphus jujuba var. spinosa TaxID=714518 RepID=A0A978UAM8_ZIZJJ|nr:hypothetical protein FEM48_Zijuj12G0023200 [Ziziphus jujuba var. spinosa]